MPPEETLGDVMRQLGIHDASAQTRSPLQTAIQGGPIPYRNATRPRPMPRQMRPVEQRAADSNAGVRRQALAEYDRRGAADMRTAPRAPSNQFAAAGQMALEGTGLPSVRRGAETLTSVARAPYAPDAINRTWSGLGELGMGVAGAATFGEFGAMRPRSAPVPPRSPANLNRFDDIVRERPWPIQSANEGVADDFFMPPEQAAPQQRSLLTQRRRNIFGVVPPEPMPRLTPPPREIAPNGMPIRPTEPFRNSMRGGSEDLADAAGMRTPNPRWSASIRDPESGQIYSGPDHFAAIESAPDEIIRQRLEALYGPDEDANNVGFLLDGKFFPREEGLRALRGAFRRPPELGSSSIQARSPAGTPTANLLRDPRLSPDEGYAASRLQAGLTPREIAEEMDTSSGVVRVLLSRARAKAPDLNLGASQTGRPRGAITDEQIANLRRQLRESGYRNERGGVNTLVAERFGMTPNAVAARIARYNRANPDNPALQAPTLPPQSFQRPGLFGTMPGRAERPQGALPQRPGTEPSAQRGGIFGRAPDAGGGRGGPSSEWDGVFASPRAGIPRPFERRFESPQIFSGEVGAPSGQRHRLSEAIRLASEGAGDTAIWERTGWTRGRDGKWRYEIDDSNARLLIDRAEDLTNERSLSGAFQHRSLFQDHPWIARIRVVSDPKLAGTKTAGASDIERGLIRLNPSLTGDDLRDTVIHEVQHFVQAREGFAGGANELVAGPRGYWTTAGEVEARNAGARMNMSAEERASTPPHRTQDTAYNYQDLPDAQMESRLAEMSQRTDLLGFEVDVVRARSRLTLARTKEERRVAQAQLEDAEAALADVRSRGRRALPWESQFPAAPDVGSFEAGLNLRKDDAGNWFVADSTGERQSEHIFANEMGARAALQNMRRGLPEMGEIRMLPDGDMAGRVPTRLEPNAPARSTPDLPRK